VKSATFPLFVWSGFLAVLWFVHLLFRPTLLSGALLGVSSAFVAAYGLGVLALRRFSGRRDVLTVPDMSVPTAVVGIGIALFCLGGEVGYWMSGVGAALVLAGGVGVLREWRVERGDPPA
jgi:hypothetical protein